MERFYYDQMKFIREDSYYDGITHGVAIHIASGRSFYAVRGDSKGTRDNSHSSDYFLYRLAHPWSDHIVREQLLYNPHWFLENEPQTVTTLKLPYETPRGNYRVWTEALKIMFTQGPVALWIIR